MALLLSASLHHGWFMVGCPGLDKNSAHGPLCWYERVCWCLCVCLLSKSMCFFKCLSYYEVLMMLRGLSYYLHSYYAWWSWWFQSCGSLWWFCDCSSFVLWKMNMGMFLDSSRYIFLSGWKSAVLWFSSGIRRAISMTIQSCSCFYWQFFLILCFWSV